MTNISFSKEKGGIHLFVVLIGIVVLVAAIGFLFWNNIVQPNQQQESSTSQREVKTLSPQETEACLKELDEKNPPLKGWSDHRDKSECYPDILSLDSLSSTEKEENKRNHQIVQSAIDSRDDTKCNEMKGMYYTPYPPNLKKVMPRTEADAKKECRLYVASKIKNDAKRTEPAQN